MWYRSSDAAEAESRSFSIIFNVERSGPLSTPLVTVVVPVFNGAKYLRESLDSILQQTYPSVEVIVMDDASTDETPDVIASYGSAVGVVRQPQTRGIYVNANDGIARAAGEFIAIYHADDVYEPNIVEREVEELLRYPEAGAVFVSDVFIDAEGVEYGRLQLPPELNRKRVLDYRTVFNALLTHQNTFLRCPGAMVRASAYREVGTYRAEMYKNTSDLDMWLRISARYPIILLDEHLFRYRHFHGSSSERYHHLRTDQGRFFKILDDYLEAGSREIAMAGALAAYEAMRAEDTLMRAVSHYILDRRAESLALLHEMSPARLLRSPKVQRGRLFVLWLAMVGITRLPRIPALAELFRRRWHRKGSH